MSKFIIPGSQSVLPPGTPVSACYLVSNTPADQVQPAADGASELRTVGRPDTLTAQRVEVGLVLQAMLGVSAATDYFSEHEVCEQIAARVLSPTGRRRGTHDANGVRTSR